MIVQCPHCHYREAVPEEYAGMIGECSKCGREFKITSPVTLQQAKLEGNHPVISFVLGFFFSLIGILVAYIIDKKNVGKAVIGFVVSVIILVLCVMNLHCSAQRTGSHIQKAVESISDEEGGKARYRVEDINENTIKMLGD